MGDCLTILLTICEVFTLIHPKSDLSGWGQESVHSMSLWTTPENTSHTLLDTTHTSHMSKLEMTPWAPNWPVPQTWIWVPLFLIDIFIKFTVLTEGMTLTGMDNMQTYSMIITVWWLRCAKWTNCMMLPRGNKPKTVNTWISISVFKQPHMLLYIFIHTHMFLFHFKHG